MAGNGGAVPLVGLWEKDDTHYLWSELSPSSLPQGHPIAAVIGEPLTLLTED